jgi:hypothetical protein
VPTGQFQKTMGFREPWLSGQAARAFEGILVQGDCFSAANDEKHKWLFRDVDHAVVEPVANYQQITLIFNDGTKFQTATPPAMYTQPTDLIDGKHKLFYALYVLCPNAK